jgi:N-acetylglucosaminyldiphosphoundecaprenol N-acetyl-beta-D-mannosaminyltransferase
VSAAEETAEHAPDLGDSPGPGSPGPGSHGPGQGLADPAESGPGRPRGEPAPLGTELGERHRARKRDFLGVGLTCLPDADFVAAVREAVATRSRLTVSFLNPDYALRAHRIPGLMEKINRFDMVLPDGWGVVLGARWLGYPVPDRQGNDDILPKVFAVSAEYGLSHCLLGYREGTAGQAAANLSSTFPGIPVAGTLHGHWDVIRGHQFRYDDADSDRMVEEVNAANADVLHVSLPTPLQQDWVWRVAGRLNVPVIITGGAYVDHLAERVYWYPPWATRLRICWLYRLSKEPRRLWKRYSLDLMVYGGMLAKAKLTRRLRAARRRAASGG